MWLAGVSWEILRPTSYWSGPIGATLVVARHTQIADPTGSESHPCHDLFGDGSGKPSKQGKSWGDLKSCLT